jgi:hypothetical protein
MNLKKYISKHFIVRLCLLLALVGAAAVFDMYHTANQKIADDIRKIPVQDNSETNKIFICNQVPTNNLKTSGAEFSIRFRLAFTQDKFLQKYYNLRTFQLMKAETLNSFFPSVCSFHSLPFNRVLYPSPDDTPPLS